MTLITQGIVIRKNHCGDFDRQYVLYTQDLGKVTAIAKGAKRPTSKMSSHLDYFANIDLMLAKGSGPYRIAGARNKANYTKIKSNIPKTAAAYLFLEALDNLTVYDYHDREMFDLAIDCLETISDATNLGQLLTVLNKSLFNLLTHSGYQPKVKSLNQRRLVTELSKLIIVATEKELKSYNLLWRVFQSNQTAR